MSQHQRIADDGRLALVRNGYLPKREILTGIGQSVSASQGTFKRWEGTDFPFCLGSALCQKNQIPGSSITMAVPERCFYRRDGGSIKSLVGHDAQGLSASTVSRLKSEWANEYHHWREAPLDEDRWAYVWVDGIYSGLRSEKDKLCALVIIGVNERGQKRFLAIEDGVRESTQSWREFC